MAANLSTKNPNVLPAGYYLDNDYQKTKKRICTSWRTIPHLVQTGSRLAQTIEMKFQ